MISVEDIDLEELLQEEGSEGSMDETESSLILLQATMELLEVKVDALQSDVTAIKELLDRVFR